MNLLLVHFLIPINYLPDFEVPYLSTSYCSACIWHPGTIFPLGQMNPVFFLRTRRRWFSCFLWPFPSPTTGSSPLMASASFAEASCLQLGSTYFHQHLTKVKLFGQGWGREHWDKPDLQLALWPSQVTPPHYCHPQDFWLVLRAWEWDRNPRSCPAQTPRSLCTNRKDSHGAGTGENNL